LRYGRADDEAVLYALGLFDEGLSIAAIAEQLERSEAWVERTIADVFNDEKAEGPIH